MTGELRAGDVVGDYRIERKIGQGGMGTVYAAVHPVIDKRVAIKLLRRDLCTNPEVVTRFIQEARAVNRIGHRNIVDVFGFGVADDGRSYLAMELLEGESLRARIKRGELAVGEICDLLVEISHALEAAHESGIVHRDLKPDNVFLASVRGGGTVVKLLDFGIAKLLVDAGPVHHTQPGTTIGTPEYIAPEQARGRPLDGSADVYSLGVIAFEMLTGRLPFESDNVVDLIGLHVSAEPPVPSTLAPLPPIADVLLRGMLDKMPAKRPSLARVRAGIEDLRRTPVPPAIRSTPARRRWPWVLGVTVATALIVTVVNGALARREPVSPPSGSALGSSPPRAPAPPTPTPAPALPALPALAAPSPSPRSDRPPIAHPPAVVERKARPRQPTHPVHTPTAPAIAVEKRDPAPVPPPSAEPPAVAAPVAAPRPAPKPEPLDDDALASPFERKKP